MAGLPDADQDRFPLSRLDPGRAAGPGPDPPRRPGGTLGPARRAGLALPLLQEPHRQERAAGARPARPAADLGGRAPSDRRLEAERGTHSVASCCPGPVRAHGRNATQARVSATPMSGVFAKLATFSVTAKP